MRIGIDIRMIGKNRTGDESVFTLLAKTLPRIDSENEYVLLIDNRTEEEIRSVERLLEIKGLHNASIRQCGSGNKFLWNSIFASRAVRRWDVDVYHTQYIVPFFIPQKTKIITHIHDVSFLAHPEYISWKDRFFLSTLIPRSLRKASKIIAVSEFTKREIVKYGDISANKIVVVPNAIDERYETTTYSDEEIATIRKKYALPNSYILHIGTMQPRKNIPFLLRGFAEVRKQLPDLALVLTGNRYAHHFDARIDSVIQELHLEDAVCFAGYIDADDLPAVISSAQICASMSIYEGFGLPVLEAMARGVPVVASDIEPYREVSENAARFVPLGDIAQLRESLYTISVDTRIREELLTRGKERVRLFSRDRSIRSVLAAYRTFL
jgi:glycosyltransferase involved in cell wall biosynthesis